MITFSGTVYRMVFAGQDATLPVASPEGRFHHAGQPAIYTSMTPEGTAVAIKRYVSSDDPPRVIVPLDVTLSRVHDLRGRPEVSVVWQEIRAGGDPAPTWAYSDAARATGAQAIMYSSRSRPDLAHLVLFEVGAEVCQLAGPPRPA